jgi:DNA-binding NtrC family response regulator
VDAREGRALEAIPLRGTLFLMGLESLSDEAQARWLPLIEGTRSEARILASASPTLFDAITSGSFDATLARLLTRFEVRLPSLRERMEDLPELVSHLAREVGAELGRTEASFTDGALRRLGRERWPGNLHELRRVVERLIAFTPAPRIGLREVEAVLEELRPSVADLRERQQLAERRELLELLDATGGNVAETAARMGRSRASIYRLVEKHGIALRRGS